MTIKTFGYQPSGGIVDRIEAAHSRSGASVALSEMHPETPRLCDELDALFARGASEAEIADFRARAALVEGDD